MWEPLHPGKRIRGPTAVLALWLVLSACAGGQDASEPQDPTLVAAGRQLYAAACAACHGPDLRGTSQGPSLLSEIYRPGHHADIAFQLAVQRGVPQHHWSFGNMAPITGLTEVDVSAIVAFVRETQRTEGFEDYPP